MRGTRFRWLGLLEQPLGAQLRVCRSGAPDELHPLPIVYDGEDPPWDWDMDISPLLVDEPEEIVPGETTMVECVFLGTIADIEPATTLIWQIELSDGTACVAQGREEVRMAAALGCETYAEYLEL